MLLEIFFPVFFIVLAVLAGHLQHRPLCSFVLPEAKSDFVGADQFKRGALQWSRDRLTTNLLPIATGLFITHNEVLIVDAGQMKIQDSAVYRSCPHQTGVT